MQEKIKEMARAIDELLVEKPKETTKHAMNVATYLFDRGYRKQEWISIADRLPDKGQEVLAYRGDFNGDMMNTYTYLGSGNWQDDYGYRGSAEHDGITHWMPLPEPPKMKGGAE